MPTSTTSARPRKRKAAVALRPKRSPVIDIHSHIRIPEVTALLQKMPHPGDPKKPQWVSTRSAGEQKQIRQQNLPKETNPEVRLKELDRLGIDFQAISVNMPAAYYYADGEAALKVARTCNDGIAEFVSRSQGRLIGLASVPFQDVARAVTELERAVNELGLRGVWILSNVRGEDLGEPRFRPFWAKAQELNVPVFIHPLGFTHPDRLQKWALWSSIGQPLEEALAMSSLIYEGVMDAYPMLKVVVCHGGGFMPYYIGRHDQTFAHRREIRDKLKKPPSTYLSRFFYDTVIFDPDMLPFLVKKAGTENVMMGTDLPYTAPDPVGFIRNARAIGQNDKEKLLWRNAAKLLHIDL